MNAHIKEAGAISYSSPTLTCHYCLMPEIVSVEDGNPLQYSCLKNSMDRGAWWATAHGVAESWT